MYLSLSSGSQIGYSAPGMSCSSSFVCPPFAPSLSLLTPAPLSLPPSFPYSLSVCQFGSPSLLFICLAPFRLLFARTFAPPRLPFFCAKCLPPSIVCIAVAKRSIVIVPHQRRSAINLSSCRAESERCALSERTTLGNTGRAINLCQPAVVERIIDFLANILDTERLRIATTT